MVANRQITKTRYFLCLLRGITRKSQQCHGGFSTLSFPFLLKLYLCIRNNPTRKHSKFQPFLTCKKISNYMVIN